MSRSLSSLIWVFAWIAFSIRGDVAARAQERDDPADSDEPSSSYEVKVSATGMEGFRYLMHREGIEPITKIQELAHEPERTIIILMGKDSIDRYLNDDIFNAVKSGASLLIASDRSSNKLETYFGYRITGADVYAHEEDCYQRKINYPFVRPVSKPRLRPDERSPHSIFVDIDSAKPNAIATNMPSVLNLLQRRPPMVFEVLAGYPFSSEIGSQFGGRVEFFPLRPEYDCFAVGGHFEDGNGRFLLLADHSVFINRMILKDDNANWAFTRNCITWLRGPEKKTHCLFIEDGKIKTEFDLPIPEPPWLDMLLKALLVMEKHGDGIVSELEERDFFNQALLMSFSRREIIRFVLIVLTIILLAVGLIRLIRSRIGPDPARTLITPELAAMIPRGNVLQQRFEGLINADDVREAAGQLVRDFFGGLGAEPDSQGRPPLVSIEDGYQDEYGLRRKIMRLWQIGYGHMTRKVAPAEWPQLTEDLKFVLEEADEGWWKFTAAS